MLYKHNWQVLFLIEVMTFKRMMMEYGYIENVSHANLTKKSSKQRIAQFLTKTTNKDTNIAEKTQQDSETASLVALSHAHESAVLDYIGVMGDTPFSPNVIGIAVLPAVRWMTSYEGILTLQDENDSKQSQTSTRTKAITATEKIPNKRSSNTDILALQNGSQNSGLKPNRSKSKSKSKTDTYIEFPSNVPKPAILASAKESDSIDSEILLTSVSNNEENKKEKDKKQKNKSKSSRKKRIDPWYCAEKIASKYIRNSSMLCINISGARRKKLLKFIDTHAALNCAHKAYIGSKICKQMDKMECENNEMSQTISSTLNYDVLEVNSVMNDKSGNVSVVNYKRDNCVENCQYHCKNNCICCYFGYCNECCASLIDERSNELRQSLLSPLYSLNLNGNDQVCLTCFDKNVMFELGHLFDAVCNEIFMLLGDSFARFQATKAYLILHNSQASIASELSTKLNKLKHTLSKTKTIPTHD